MHAKRNHQSHTHHSLATSTQVALNLSALQFHNPQPRQHLHQPTSKKIENLSARSPLRILHRGTPGTDAERWSAGRLRTNLTAHLLTPTTHQTLTVSVYHRAARATTHSRSTTYDFSPRNDSLEGERSPAPPTAMGLPRHPNLQSQPTRPANTEVAMRHAVSSLCTLIVALQILIGVPLVVCVGFYLLVAGNAMGPIAFEVHSDHAGSPATIPPPNLIPQPVAALADNPILETRAQQGSPLAGTVLESTSPDEENTLFVAAIEKAAAEKSTEPPRATIAEPTLGNPASESSAVTDLRKTADQFAVQQLYAIAESDEQAGQFHRADQWRAFARVIRGAATESEIPAVEVQCPPSEDTLSLRPARLDSPH